MSRAPCILLPDAIFTPVVPARKRSAQPPSHPLPISGTVILWPVTLRKIKTEIEAKVKVEKSQNLILENAASPAHPRFGVVRKISNFQLKEDHLQFQKYVDNHSFTMIT
jgi:hypothetical protein